MRQRTAAPALLAPQEIQKPQQKKEEGEPEYKWDDLHEWYSGEHTHEWFNPVEKFGPVVGAKGKAAPLLLYLPGNDGSGLTPVMQFPELASAFEIQCLAFEGRDRSNFTQIKAIVKAKLREAK